MLAEDPALLASFLDESLESLGGLEARMVDLDSAQDVRAEIEAIFRPVHTLKGNAPFFGFMEIQRLAHNLETVLDHLRKGLLVRSQAITDVLFAGLDGLRGCVDRIRAGEPEVVDSSAFSALVDRLALYGNNAPSSDPWSRVFANLADIEKNADQFDPITQSQLSKVRLDLTTLRGVSSAVPAAQHSNDRVSAIRQRLGKPLDTTLDAASAEAVVADLKVIRATCQDVEHGKLIDNTLETCRIFIDSVGFDDMMRKSVLELLDNVSHAPTAVATGTTGTPTTSGSALSPSTDVGSERRSRQASESHAKSMRVSEAAVDGFLVHVGEMQVISDRFEYLQQRMTASAIDPILTRDMRQAVTSFSILSTALQRSIMEVRQVPVRSLLQKAPRLARDIAKAKGKDIAVVTHGEATELDKGRIDLLDGPLTHLVRNCADHGIETPEKRRLANKPERGTITLSASVRDGWFHLDISDDGAGLDLDAIRRKGESLGLLKPGVLMDEQTVVDLIFASGLSTAAAVTDVSGRGVGMDVVKQQIKEVGGSVTVVTTRGKGTAFSLKIPSAVSTQIISAFLIRDGTAIFALPLDVVRELFVDQQAPCNVISGVIVRHDLMLPVAPLGQILGQMSTVDETQDRRRVFVTIEFNGRNVAVTVDEMLGVRRLVIRPLTGVTADASQLPFQGAALLGDGQLALVVDPGRLLQRMNSHNAHG
mgnify:CR=1 FL=1